MPDIIGAITGQASFPREKEKAKRLVLEEIGDLPNWAKNWTPSQAETFVDAALDGITDLASAITILKQILPKMAWMEMALRDFMLLKQEES